LTDAVVRNVSLKDANASKLFALLAANVVFFYLFIHADLITTQNWSKLLGSWITVVPAGVGVALVGILNGQISSDMKARMVFLRWHFPYPGSRAFTDHGPQAMSVDMLALQRRYGSLPTDPKEQNILWYRLYHAVADLPAVAQAHRHFLFARDYAFMSSIMLLALGGSACVIARPATDLAIYITFLIVQWVLALNAANVGGRRLVTVVLAQNSASQ
jgi:hypothetical protein